jgi:hypothetical protein
MYTILRNNREYYFVFYAILNKNNEIINLLLVPG